MNDIVPASAVAPATGIGRIIAELVCEFGPLAGTDQQIKMRAELWREMLGDVPLFALHLAVKFTILTPQTFKCFPSVSEVRQRANDIIAWANQRPYELLIGGAWRMLLERSNVLAFLVEGDPRLDEPMPDPLGKIVQTMGGW